MNIKDMNPVTGHGKTVAYFALEFPADTFKPGFEFPMVIINFRLIEGKNGLFAGVPQQEYTQAGVKKWKDIMKLGRAEQNKVNAAAIEAYRLLGAAPAPAEPDYSDIPF